MIPFLSAHQITGDVLKFQSPSHVAGSNEITTSVGGTQVLGVFGSLSESFNSRLIKVRLMISSVPRKGKELTRILTQKQ